MLDFFVFLCLITGQSFCSVKQRSYYCGFVTFWLVTVKMEILVGMCGLAVYRCW